MLKKATISAAYGLYQAANANVGRGRGDTGVRGKQNAFRANARANPYQAYWRDFRSSAAGDK